MKKKVYVEGMSCGHCVMHVQNALLEIKGVKSAKVDLNSKIALVEADRDLTEAEIKAAVEDAGYEAVKVETAQ